MARDAVRITDSGFSALEFLSALRRHGVTCVTRLRLDAALCQPAPPRLPGTIGRPRTKGARLPTLAEVLADKTTRWQRITVPGWYGEGGRVVEVCSNTAVWRHSGLPVVPIRWVLLRGGSHAGPSSGKRRRPSRQALGLSDTTPLRGSAPDSPKVHQ